jgi:hypothetical protein
MKRKKNDRKKLSLSRETLAPLEAKSLETVAGAAVLCPKESNQICSIQHTCVSCVYTADTCA